LATSTTGPSPTRRRTSSQQRAAAPCSLSSPFIDYRDPRTRRGAPQLATRTTKPQGRLTDARPLRAVLAGDLDEAEAAQLLDRAGLRRLVYPTHGVHREAAPLPRAGSRLTRDLEDLVGWLATTMDKTAVCRPVRIDWDNVGQVITRVMDDGLDPDRLEALFDVGVGE